MGTRYILPVTCPECDLKDEAYYAPTCDFLTHTCVNCGYVIDLEELSYEDASNAKELAQIVSLFGVAGDGI